MRFRIGNYKIMFDRIGWKAYEFGVAIRPTYKQVEFRFWTYVVLIWKRENIVNCDM